MSSFDDDKVIVLRLFDVHLGIRVLECQGSRIVAEMLNILKTSGKGSENTDNV